MKIKGVMNDSPFVLEETVIMAICRLCDMFVYTLGPKVDEEDDSVIVTNERGTILFRGTSDEMLLFKEAIKLAVGRYEAIQKIGHGSPTERVVRIAMENLKDHIADAMEFKKQCAPRSSLTEALYQMAESSYAC